MPRGRGRGGSRTPRSPAPVSGPGALSRRTDGGPTQPVRSAPMDQHGERQQIENAQSAVPLPRDQGPTVDGPLGPARVRGGGQAPPQGDVFSPMTPTEQASPAGMGRPIVPASPDEELALLFESYPSPELFRLLNMRRRDGGA